MTFRIEIEGLDELRREWDSARADLDRDLDRASLAAADDGIQEVKERHPYTDRTGDLTGNAHVEVGDVAMVWPEGYASYVDKGTSRSKPYPYTPEAMRVAEKSLEIRSAFAADDCAKRMSR